MIEQLFKELEKARVNAKTEEDIKIAFETSFKNYLPNYGIVYDASYEKKVKSGRIDAIFGHIILEYKEPNKLSSKAAYNKAVKQTLGYIDSEASLGDRHRYISVLLDGYHIGFVRYRLDGTIEDSGCLIFNKDTLVTLITYFHSLNFKALTAENILSDFGPNKDNTINTVRSLWMLFRRQKNSRTNMFFQEWKRLFGQVSGFGVNAGPEQEIQREAEHFGIEIKGHYAEFIFVLHTYYSILIKSLAYYILRQMRRHEPLLFAEIDTNDIKDFITKLEDGTHYRSMGIVNFLEGDFFSWYLKEWNDELEEAIKQIQKTFLLYDPATPSLMPEAVKDLLKLLYEKLLPKTIRHNMGEFYTPDWLAEYTIKESGFKPSDKVLDPTCGSGTFLVILINQVMKHYYGKMNPLDLTKHILSHIYGFDLNPLAVVASRTNYLLAISPLLKHIDSDIEIPVYLTDAIFSPQKQTDNYTYFISTDKGRIDIEIPAIVLRKGLLAKYLVKIEELVQNTSEGHMTKKKAHNYLIRWLRKHNLDIAESYAIALYNSILMLEYNNWNRIWCRIIKNHYTSVMLENCDVIVGNPPWLRWSALPESYRDSIKPFCQRYGLFSTDKFVGGIESDISTMVLYTAAQKWLKTGGYLAFLITRTVFKTESSEGFRKFVIPNSQDMYFKVLKVEDFTQLKPFEGATNKPTLVVVRKGEPTQYPLPWIVWNKTSLVKDTMSLDEVVKITKQDEYQAWPLYEGGGPWLTVHPEIMPQCIKFIGENQHYLARKGICTDNNAIYYGTVVQARGETHLLYKNSPELGRDKTIKIKTTLIEKSIVYPLARGREISAFKWNFGNYYTLLPQESMDAYSESIMEDNYPKTLNYFRPYKKKLKNRSSYKRYHSKRKGAPYYSCWNVGVYTFAPYKVAWAEVSSRFETCVLSSIFLKYWDNARIVIPDHKIYFVPLESEEEAHYLCAFLNAPQVEEFVLGYAENTQIGTHVTEYLNIPVFDRSNELHILLANISKQAHLGAISAGDARSQVKNLIKDIK